MSAEFQVGDVVVCVLGGPTIEVGTLHRIVGFRVGEGRSRLGASQLGLFLKGKTSSGAKGTPGVSRNFPALTRASSGNFAPVALTASSLR